jgi:hypothetical protein
LRVEEARIASAASPGAVSQLGGDGETGGEADTAQTLPALGLAAHDRERGATADVVSLRAPAISAAASPDARRVAQSWPKRPRDGPFWNAERAGST